MTAYVLWGTPAGQTDPLYEQPLTTRPNVGACEYVAKIAAKDGWHSFRVQVLDGTVPDFARCITR